MSVENAKKFIQEKANDKATAEKVNSASSPEAIVTIAAEEGYDFTLPELQEVIKSVQGEQELDLEELEAVAGGSLKDFCGVILNFGPELVTLII